MKRIKYKKPNEAQVTRLQPSWANEPTYVDLNRDYQQALVSHDMFLDRLDEYRETLGGGPKINVRKGKSDVRPLLVRKNNEWKYSQLEEPFLTSENIIKLKAKNVRSRAGQQQTSMMINYHWSVSIDKITLVGNIARSLTDDGTVIVKNGWNTELEYYTEKKIVPVYANAEESLQIMRQMVDNGEITTEQMTQLMQQGKPIQTGEEEIDVKKSRVIANHPTHFVCEPEHVVIDPTAKGILQDAQFLIEEYDVDLSKILKDKWDPETNTGFYKNIDTIDFNRDLEDYDRYDNDETKSFIFSDRARKKVRIREYWGKWDIHGNGIAVPIVASWIDTTMVRLQKNPFKHQKIPFSLTTYMPIVGKMQGEPDAALLKENQDSIGKMTRAYHDITSTRAVGQKIVMEDTFSSQSEWDSFEKGNNARSRANVDLNRAIHTVGTESVDDSVFKVIQLQKEDAESLTGNSLRDKKISGSSNQNPDVIGMSGVSTSSERREQSLLRRMSSQLFKDMISQDIINMQAFSSPEEVVRITDSEFITIKKEDIQGQYDINIDVNTPGKNAKTAQTLSFILQAAGESLDKKVKNMVLADILRLENRSDLAKKIEESKPELSEAQKQAQDMQLQKAKLDLESAQIENELLREKVKEHGSKIEINKAIVGEYESKITENHADVKWKEAKANESEKRADYYESQADLSKAKLVNELDGVTRERELNDMEFKEKNKQNVEELKAKVALANPTNAEAAAQNKGQ